MLVRSSSSSLTRVRIRKVRKKQEALGLAFGSGVVTIKPLLLATTKPVWLDTDKFPESGGCIVVMNHVSHIDPMTACHFFYDHGRVPRFLAKSTLFKTRALGAFLRNAGQIPVERQSTNAVSAFASAVEAVHAGKCLVIYPEGTLSRDPDMWPMAGKSGAARIALETKAPVIPVGQWGAQDWLPPYQRYPSLAPRKTVTMKVGDPVDFGDLLSLERTPEVVQDATERIMEEITHLVEDIRGLKAPEKRFDMRDHGVRRIGNPHKPHTPDTPQIPHNPKNRRSKR